MRELLIEIYRNPIILHQDELYSTIVFYNKKGQLHRLNNLPAYILEYNHNSESGIEHSGFYKNGVYIKRDIKDEDLEDKWYDDWFDEDEF